jgi:titin
MNRISGRTEAALLLLLCFALVLPGEVQASTFTVTTTADSGPGSLRQAILDANSNAGPDEIDFALNPVSDPGCSAVSEVCTIQPTSELPPLTDYGTTIDGYSQAGAEPATASAVAKIRVVLDGSAIITQASGLAINDSGEHLIKGLAIVNFTGNGIYVFGPNAANITIEGCHIGVDYLGTSAAPNGLRGIYLNTSANANVIGGMSPAERNVISGNISAGVELVSDTNENIIRGNYIGTDATGLVDMGNGGTGVYMLQGANANLIGGVSSGAGNVISGNEGDGVTMMHNATSNNQVQGNLIGLAADGVTDLGNTGNGVQIVNGAHNNTVGGATVLARNVISGNGQNGVLIWTSGTDQNLVTGNYIGTNESGTSAVQNDQNGVYLNTGAQNNTIGGDSVGERNLISGNGFYGVHVASPNNVVSGNYIGTHVSGVSAISNQYGIGINNTDSNTVGGSALGEGNLISGNNIGGVMIFGASATGNDILGNLIGVDSSGDVSLGNGAYGISVAGGASNNTIGGAGSYEGNQIAGHTTGVYLTGSGTDTNTVIGNYIGTDGSGELPIPNTNGVKIDLGAQFNEIGGSQPGEGNVISGNDSFGVFLNSEGTQDNTVCGNIIGLNDEGNATLPNGSVGVEIYIGTDANTIGGGTPGCRNIISGNDGPGVRVYGSGTDGNTISGNYIGTDETGTSMLSNKNGGVEVSGGATNTIIGGTAPGEGNLISGNTNSGVAIYGSGTTGTQIIANRIGTDQSGMLGVPNLGYGVQVGLGADGNTVGPLNLIAFNNSDGVYVNNTSQVTITENSIHSNSLMGIDLIGTGNDGLPAPTITQVTLGSVTIEGSGAPSNGIVEVFGNPDADGEGKTFLGSTTADGSGAWSLTLACVGDPYLTATATDLTGNTSEFSVPFGSSNRCAFLPLIMR